MKGRIVFTEKLKEVISGTDSLAKLKEKGIDDIESLGNEIINKLNLYNNKLNIHELVFEDLKLDTYEGVIYNEKDLKVGYIFIVPPKLGTRSGFIAQQVFGSISNKLLVNNDSRCYEISNLPVYIINADVDEINLSKAINIVSSKILNFHIVDVYGRSEKQILIEKKNQSSFSSLIEYDELLKSDDGTNEYFEVDENSKTIKFKTNKLKNLSESLTNEPYYFAIKAYPALYLASSEKYSIEINDFESWHQSGQNENKNIKAFYSFASRLKNPLKNHVQKINYGAPGTGKSFSIDKMLKDEKVSSDYIFRATFHPEYSYSDFIGQLLPKVVIGDKNEKSITYEFSKGIFTQALEKAYENTFEDVYLILEEMSRGDVAAIFGDIFQLLDRFSEGDKKGYSRYFVNNEIVAQDIIFIIDDKIKLPANLLILGTVNTSDQNVFVMDTAFKRRFDWEYISTKPIKLNATEWLNNPKIDVVYPDVTNEVEWVRFYNGLNIFISNSNYLELGEDKQIGPFFIEFEANENKDSLNKKLQNKLLHYLWNDVQKASFKRGVSLFLPEISSFSDLYEKFGEKKNVFSKGFLECLDIVSLK